MTNKNNDKKKNFVFDRISLRLLLETRDAMIQFKTERKEFALPKLVSDLSSEQTSGLWNTNPILKL
jgi:hypothetical protein